MFRTTCQATLAGVCSEWKSANASSGSAAGVHLTEHVLRATPNNDDQLSTAASITSAPVASEGEETDSLMSARASTAVSRPKYATTTSRKNIPVEPPLKALSLDDTLELEFTWPDYGT